MSMFLNIIRLHLFSKPDIEIIIDKKYQETAEEVLLDKI